MRKSDSRTRQDTVQEEMKSNGGIHDDRMEKKRGGREGESWRVFQDDNKVITNKRLDHKRRLTQAPCCTAAARRVMIDTGGR